MKPLSFSLGLALVGLLHAGPAIAATPVSPDDAKLQYTGRVDFSQPAAPVISWPNTSIAGRFTGTSLAIKLDDQRGRNYFNVFLDGDLSAPLVVEAKQGEATYVVAQKLAPGTHSFLITKRTEGEEGATVFRGLELDHGAQLLPPPPRPKRRIEFFGDSITSGMGNEGAVNGRDDAGKDKNSFLSYAAIAARQLNAEVHMTSQSGIGVMISWFPFTMPDFYDQLSAEVHMTSQSGIGVMISWFPFTMPDFYDQLSAVGDNDSQWDFKRWTPDVVVVNLLQNDSWLIGRDHKLQPEPDDAQRVEAYKNFVQRIRRLYPQAYIVCALGSMDATRPGSPWPGYVRAAVERMRKEDGEKRIDTLFFDYTGYGQHPRVHHHRANAAKLTALVRARMGW